MIRKSSQTNKMSKRQILMPFLFGLIMLFSQQTRAQENKKEVLSNGKIVKKYSAKKLENSNVTGRKGEFDENTLQFVYTKKGISVYNEQEGKIKHINWVAEDYEFKKKK